MKAIAKVCTGEESTRTVLGKRASLDPVNPVEPVSMIKDKKVEGDVERLLELVLRVVIDHDWIRNVNSDSSVSINNVLLCILADISSYVSVSEKTVIALDKSIEEAQNTLNELIKRKEGLK